jgi:hypothetical protein
MMDKKAQGTPNLSTVFVGSPQTPVLPTPAPSAGKAPPTPNLNQMTPPSDPSNQPSASKPANDIMTMQEKLVELSNALNDPRLKATVPNLDNEDIENIGNIGSAADPHKADGIWAARTVNAMTFAALFASRIIDVAKEHNLTLDIDANDVAALRAAATQKSAKRVSIYLDKLLKSLPEVANAVFKQPGTAPTATGLSDAEKFRLAQVSNAQVAIIQLKHRSVPVMFADLATPDAFQKFLAANKIRNGQLVLQYLSKVLKTKVQPTQQQAPGVI